MLSGPKRTPIPDKITYMLKNDSVGLAKLDYRRIARRLQSQSSGTYGKVCAHKGVISIILPWFWQKAHRALSIDIYLLLHTKAHAGLLPPSVPIHTCYMGFKVHTRLLVLLTSPTPPPSLYNARSHLLPPPFLLLLNIVLSINDWTRGPHCQECHLVI